mgnify:CR=1 FL=1
MKQSETECAKRNRRLFLSSRKRWSRNLDVSDGHSFRIVPPENWCSLIGFTFALEPLVSNVTLEAAAGIFGLRTADHRACLYVVSMLQRTIRTKWCQLPERIDAVDVAGGLDFGRNGNVGNRNGLICRRFLRCYALSADLNRNRAARPGHRSIAVKSRLPRYCAECTEGKEWV